MSDAAGQEVETVSARSFVVMLVLIAGLIGVLFLADSFLAGVEKRASHGEARDRFREGQRLMERGKPREAIERFSDALSIERGTREYQLALADAALAADRPVEAAAAASATLEHDATDGAANLAIARSYLEQNRATEAIAYFHRAVYGHWPEPSAERRRAVRFELVDLLAARGLREDLLAELLALEPQSAADTALRRRIGHLFLTAGAPTRAVPIFREILARAPADADALGGLGAAEFGRGNYRSAEADLSRAVRLAPEDSTLVRTLEMVGRVRALDPLERSLGARDRQQRSRNVLTMVVDAASRCASIPSSGAVRAAIDSARTEVAKRPAGAGESARLLDRADAVWSVLDSGCRRPAGGAVSALELVMDKLNQ